jgi:hypothetical protein
MECGILKWQLQLKLTRCIDKRADVEEFLAVMARFCASDVNIEWQKQTGDAGGGGGGWWKEQPVFL